MAIEFEIDSPEPGEVVGFDFNVMGTFNLDTHQIINPVVRCYLKDQNGNPLDDPGEVVRSSGPLVGQSGTWTVSFELEEEHTGCQIYGFLEFGDPPFLSQTVENIEVDDDGGAEINLEV
jgi:hypothetical protein